MRALKDQALDTERKEARKPDARWGFMEDEEEVGDKAAIGDGDGNGRVITRISEGNQLRRANPSPTCLPQSFARCCMRMQPPLIRETARIESNHILSANVSDRVMTMVPNKCRLCVNLIFQS
ncbi:uncharacterized protein K441DRAFT_142881 [Cenococcum geophilum 1.58]|uniref:uncharacterized protein n=1 Tax=Cenococcum geophilum 1.58 TaxID=794803 RepID=UPI00358FF1DC|nr:hypothetical protein K441DRAFT_142881 [Cenococcum geophilum 1.58]